MATPKIRPIRVDGQAAYIPLTKGLEAVVDAKDLGIVEGYNWFAQRGRRGTFYAARMPPRGSGKRRMIYMHREIAKTPDGLITDHIDSDGLNNTRGNLRDATVSENQCNQRLAAHNSSGVKGVHFDKTRGKWRAEIRLNGKKFNKWLPTLEAAVTARAALAASLHGEFGRTA